MQRNTGHYFSPPSSSALANPSSTSVPSAAAFWLRLSANCAAPTTFSFVRGISSVGATPPVPLAPASSWMLPWGSSDCPMVWSNVTHFEDRSDDRVR